MARELTAIARTLRRSMTPWESKLWRLLRGRRFRGFKFRRQYPVGKYIVDFCCLERHLIIELDGGRHNEPAARLEDEMRDAYLCNHGYTVIRFWNNEFKNNLEGVYQKISDVLTRPAATLSLRERGG